MLTLTPSWNNTGLLLLPLPPSLTLAVVSSLPASFGSTATMTQRK